MHTSKLLDLIRVFEPAELETFDKFLQSPYFRNIHSAKEIFLLWQHIYACCPDLDHPNLTKAEVYKVLFPDQAFVALKVDRIMSNLLAFVKEFIIFEFSDLKTDEVQGSLVLARFYRQRHLAKPFRQSLKKLNQVQEKQKRQIDFYLHQYLINDEVSRFESFHNLRKGDSKVPEAMQSLDVFYLVHKLKGLCWMYTQDKITTQEIEQKRISYYDFIKPFKAASYFEEVALLKVYDLGIRLMLGEEKQEEIFQKLKSILKEEALSIPIDSLKELQGLCRNYCLLEYNKGKVSYLGEMFDLYRNHLEEGYLNYEDGLLPATIRNIVVAGLRLEEYDWVYHFLEKYKNRIVASNQAHEIYLFNLATYYFATQKYAIALDCLVDRYEDIYYLIAAKRMELKIYYEMKNPILESKMDAFKVYIFRLPEKVILEHKRTCNNNFINFLRQLHNPKTNFSSKRIDCL